MIIFSAILIVIFFQLANAIQIANCPPIPSSCFCEVGESGMLSVKCAGDVLASLLTDLGTLPLEHLRISQCTQPVLDSLPKGPIRSLEISNCKIEKIDRKIFTEQKSLEKIALTNNSLTEIPDFGMLSQLISLDLSGNQIQEISENALQGVKSVQQLRLERNKICSLYSKSLDEVKETIQLLDLSGNCFSRIPAHNLRNCNKLMYLDLGDNKISEINNFELMNLPQLQEVRLNNNELRNLHPMAFMNVPQLRFLFIRDNLLSFLDGNKLQVLSQLEVLDVTNNLLSKVPTLKDFPRLKQVLLDGNLIEKIETLTFSNNSQLHLISIQNNNIVQIARNSFDSLDRMQVLLLGNNSLSTVERGMLDGMRSLSFLHLRNNSIARIDRSAFTSVLNLHSLDLSYNKLSFLEQKTFINLVRLMWLDLSNNQLQGFEPSSFSSNKLETILLDGNQWRCDEKLEWFITFLVANRVRTFLPRQKEIECAEPPQFHGVKLGDLMLKKSNETEQTSASKQDQASIISSFLPSFIGNNNMAVPALPAFTQKSPIPTGMNTVHNSDAQKFSTGQLTSNDVSQYIRSIPNFIVNIPGFGNVDLAKVDPNIIDFVLKGGQLPGIPKETMDSVIHETQSYMRKVHEAAAANKQSQQTSVSQEHIEIQRVTASPTLNVNGINSQPLAELWKMLPPNYNISRIPQSVLSSVLKGELPDFNNLPEDLISHFKRNADKMASLFNKIAPANTSLDDLLAKLPKFEKPVLATFSPYDINKLSADMIHEEELKAKAAKMKIYTSIALGLVGTVTLVVLGFFVIYLRKQRINKAHAEFCNQTSALRPSFGTMSDASRI